MNPILISEEYSFIIDTNAESYDFAKKLCAYCTGFLSEDESNQKFSDIFYTEMSLEDDDSPRGRVSDEKNPFFNCIIDRRDSSDVFSPCSVWLSRDYGSNEEGEYSKITADNYSDYELPAPFSVGIFFDVEPTAEQIGIIKDRAVKFFSEMWLEISKETVKVEGFRLISHKKYGEEKDL